MNSRKKAAKRVFSILLALCMVVMLMPTVPVRVEAATGGHTRNEAVVWAKGWEGNAQDFDGNYGIQCVDLIQYYYNYLGQTPVSGNAYDYVNNALPSGWQRFGNDTKPEPGDIVVFGAYFFGSKPEYQYGHIGIVTDVSQTYTYIDFNNTGNHDVAGFRKNNALNRFTCIIRPDWIGGESSNHNPVFWNNNQSAGEDFYAYIYSYCGERYVESGKNIEDVTWPFTYVMQSTKPEYVGASLNPNKIWHFTRSPGADYYFIQNEYSGWTLEMAGGQAEREKKLITYYDFHQNEQQQWVILAGGEGNNYRLMPKRNKSDETLLMDVAGGIGGDGVSIQLWTENYGVPQQFMIVPISYSKPSKPAAPSNISAFINSDNTGIFEWNEVARTGSYDSRQYEYWIYKGNPEGGELVGHNITSATVTPSYNFAAGDYTFQVRTVNKMYRDLCSDVAVKKVTIRNDALVNRWPDAGAIFYGQTLADSQLTGGTADVAGSFEWKNSIWKPKPGDSCDVLFIPDDTSHYSQCSGKISVTVNKTRPKVTAPDAGVISSGEKLAASVLSGGTAVNPYDNEVIVGSWEWFDSTQKPLESGAYHAVFIPNDTTCYENSEPVDVVVSLKKDETAVEVESVSFDKDTLTLDIGAQEVLTVKINPENATNKGLTWESSNTSIIEVSDNGMVTAISAGNAEITVISANGKTASCQVTVEETETEEPEKPDEHTHIYDSGWKSDAESHWKECKCGDKSEIAAHDFIWETDEDLSSGHEECHVCGRIEKTENSDSDNSDNPEKSDSPSSEESDELDTSEPNTTDIQDNNLEEDSGGQYIGEDTDGVMEISIVWEPATPEEKRRYECFGKEEAVYDVSADNNYEIIIENAMQGPLCFDAFDSVIGDYIIGITYNIYPNSGYDVVYNMREKVQFTLWIPAAIYEPKRKYKMICVTKNGEVIIYDDLDNISETITVRTNNFYAYALVYK